MIDDRTRLRDALAKIEVLEAERDEARNRLALYEQDELGLLRDELEAAEAERDRLIAERQRLTDENDKGVRALWDEKNKFMEALEVEMVEKKALIAERERLRDEIDADCIRIVAAEAERDMLREALEPFAALPFVMSMTDTSVHHIPNVQIRRARAALEGTE
jgi:chromosome segregation ATPase